MTPKDVLCRNFSRSARSYDRYAGIQHECGRELIHLFDGHRPLSILDIGCGTGGYTSLLHARFPRARITGMDLSAAMIRVAREKCPHRTIRFVQGDAETAPLRGPWDGVTSNAVFQWIDDLPALLRRIAASLCPRGMIVFSLFGAQTYHELRAILTPRYAAAAGSPLTPCGKKDLVRMLSSCYRAPLVSEREYRREYRTLWELLRTIKFTGTQGGRTCAPPFTRGWIARAEERYRKTYGGIVATYQVFFCAGVRR